ncbi:leucyl aminopeptidase family protein [Pseudonocardia sp. TMWB2A]|uniref:leucyl aminopeptidase family protein n=1 Tax=Pseudonocardia sp. TMWB2A TaxID=687430 RepID=UPI00307F86A9
MTDFSKLVVADTGQPARTIHLVDKAGYEDWFKAQSTRTRAQLEAQKFQAGGFEKAIIPGDGDEDWAVVSAVADVGQLSSWCLARLGETLPAGTYRLEGREPGAAILGWMLGQYRYTRYKKDEKPTGARILLTGEVARIAEAVAAAEATALVRDLVNTPASDMGPAELAHAAEKLAKSHDAKVNITKGEALAQGFPMVHAVGKAADKARAPRLVELEWGNLKHPRIALVGKGVCFDSGGLDIKPAAGMLLMKKDMGGAAHVIGLAHIIMAMKLPVRLHVVIGAVENAISGDAMRPGDVLASRKGLTVEVNNTDAEGRLVLGDALTRACEEKPELVVDFATLTGAARVALGPDLPPVFANTEGMGEALVSVGHKVDDPVWHMPLWAGYEDMLKTDMADIDNSPAGGFAGAITAALFLKRFVEDGTRWLHFDTFAWRPAAKPGRPKGGDALGMRAMWTYLKGEYAKG